MFDKKSENLIKKVCGTAYKKGFLDGMNFQRGFEEDSEEISDSEFEKLGISKIINDVIKKFKDKKWSK